MTLNNESMVLKRFLDNLDTAKLCEITRSVYHGGAIRINTREEAETMLLTQPSWRILTCKKTPLQTIVLFLIKHGINVAPDINKIQAVEYFKLLLDPTGQQVALPNPMIRPALFQNLEVQAIQPTAPTDAVKLLEDFIKMFGKNFYELLNNMGAPGKNQLDGRYFYENCSMTVRILSASQEIDEKYQNTMPVLESLLNIKTQHQLFFSPHLADEIKWKKESHGLLKVQIGGTLHQGIGRMVGIFEQQFILREDPVAKNTWKILQTSLILKNMDRPQLSLGEPSQLCITES
ncbi:uncharacterized protein C3orf38 homolog [Adelges cooleyi]|uniref:uncharacterized protein C3orf38 homolog n=1 Tax=Adelges cooleyi TaxID=133065 RepID=UPI00217F5523|nr:uncharacterized protein C3orf38 homolog [Adelges cooleyi]XP_050426366.1 uncharacterized protein C3orf38 homolog [Adelges cooleyi]